MALKDAYISTDIATLLCISDRAIRDRAKREGWQSRPRAGRGGGAEWLVPSMPEATRLAIQVAEERAALALVESSAPVVYGIPVVSNPAILDDKRRYRALAKADLVRLYLDWQRKHGATVHQKEAFLLAYQGGAWPKLLAEFGPEVSWKSLERWKLEQEKAGSVLALADKRGLAHRGRSLLTDQHRSIILGHVLNPNAAKASQCVRQIQKRCEAESIFVPSEATIRRFINTYASECYGEYILWREGKKAWNDKCAISLLRDWSLVRVGDVVFADGHTLNFETINPDTGKPCRMTLLLFFDGASTHPLGWEIMATENTACISAAFRRTCLLLGKFPAVIYIDNGKAFRAKFFKGCKNFSEAGFLGLYKDLGCEVIHAWPYHGQSKTVERFFGTMLDMEIWIPSYTGYDIAHKPARMKRGETLHRSLYEKMGSRPLTLEETHMAVAKWFCEYVQRPQHDTHLQGRTPAEIFNAEKGPGLSSTDTDRLTLLMMQKEIRTISKDGIRLNNRLYWDSCLASRRHPVLVRYDELLTPHEVKVYTLDGRFLCTALDREQYGIACGLHPVARILGTAEQQEALENALALKKNQEKDSAANLRIMLETVVLPELQVRQAAIEAAVSPAPVRPIEARAPALSQAEIDAIETAKQAGRAALEANPTYTPSALKRWRDEPERYAYLFNIVHEQGMTLVPEDAAWMATFEQSPEYQRNLKARYDSFRELYRFREASAKTA